MLLDAIHHQAMDVANLLLPQILHIDTTALLDASVKYGFQPGVNIALSSGAIQNLDLELLQNAVLTDLPGILTSLLNVRIPIYFSDIYLTSYDNAVKALLKLAAAKGKLQSLDVLLTTNIAPSFGQNIVLEEAIEANPDNIIDVTKHLLASPRFNPNLGLATLLRAAAIMELDAVISVLLDDPRTQLTPGLLDSVITSLKGRTSPKIISALQQAA